MSVVQDGSLSLRSGNTLREEAYTRRTIVATVIRTTDCKE
jgi:hypothetical protein